MAERTPKKKHGFGPFTPRPSKPLPGAQTQVKIEIVDADEEPEKSFALLEALEKRDDDKKRAKAEAQKAAKMAAKSEAKSGAVKATLPSSPLTHKTSSAASPSSSEKILKRPSACSLGLVSHPSEAKLVRACWSREWRPRGLPR